MISSICIIMEADEVEPFFKLGGVHIMDKEKVYEVYDKIIDWFDDNRTKDLSMEQSYLDFIQQHIPKGGSVLDVGCGTAEPMAKYFIEHGYKLTGVDASVKMIARCRQRYPKQRWLEADMRSLVLDEQFDLVLAWHSFFHLPHEAQSQTLQSLISFIKPQGLLVFTSGPEYSEQWSDNGGHDLYHASLSLAEYENILCDNDMQLLVHKVQDPSCGDATVWVAQKLC